MLIFRTPGSATTARPMRTTPRGDPNPYPTPDGGNTDDGPEGEGMTRVSAMFIGCN